MISPADIFCLVIVAGLMVLEANRGIIPAVIDFLGILIAVVLTRELYVPLSEYMLPSGAYMLLMGGLTLITVIFSTYVGRRLAISVTEIEAAIAAALGLSAGMLLSYAFFQWLTIRYGGGTLLVSNSLLYWAMTKFAGLRAVVDFFHQLLGR